MLLIMASMMADLFVFLQLSVATWGQCDVEQAVKCAALGVVLSLGLKLSWRTQR